MTEQEKTARDTLRDLEFKMGQLTGQVKQAQSEAIREAANKCANSIVKLVQEEKGKAEQHWVLIFLNDFAQEIRDIIR